MYILWNYEMDEPIAVSKDKGLLQEIMCDCFMNDAYMEYCYDCLLADSTIKDAWDSTLDWYHSYMNIVDAPFYS